MVLFGCLIVGVDGCVEDVFFVGDDVVDEIELYGVCFDVVVEFMVDLDGVLKEGVIFGYWDGGFEIDDLDVLFFDCVGVV